MKALVKLTLLAFLLPLYGHAQEPDDRGRERIDAMRIAYITEQVDFSTEEAQKFWPLHNEFEAKMEVIRRERHAIMERRMRNPELTNADEEELAEEMLTMFELDQRELNLKKEYHTKYLSVLSPKKVALLYMAQEKFKRELIRRISNRGRPERDYPQRGRGSRPE
ncbi:hypothetical protein [Phaeocystidibacter marisrubri]|uniref:Periplasmic heavy metal sensor n=1 Tax=Phaeocystidibacter marisrubri TaxID=1577780 RepID=A0A6L3ZIK4_9FLAO|nr:hypothetical protein [Phaeocystidibacter marisrubri]KAB2817305.1 hypothetical protein F8C82_02625 [Phaeocystidibacter marisrubri]GGH76017.1 hypothetical protein GCM10011318_23640 [Phaeocystidibacter marisrubri]